MRKLPLAMLGFLLASAGCGKKPPPAPQEETPEYLAWKGNQIVRQFPDAGAPTVLARIEVRAPGERSRSPADFCEIYLNGEALLRFPVSRLPSGDWPRWEGDVRLRAGPNWLDLWDSTTNRNCRRQIDSREGTDFVFLPAPDGYEMLQSRRE